MDIVPNGQCLLWIFEFVAYFQKCVYHQIVPRFLDLQINGIPLVHHIFADRIALLCCVEQFFEHLIRGLVCFSCHDLREYIDEKKPGGISSTDMAQQEGSDEKETAVSQGLLWSVSEKVQIDSDRYIFCDKDSGWQQIGINHDIDTTKDKKTSWTVKVGEAHADVGYLQAMVGIGTRKMISVKDCFTGEYMFGFDFYSRRGHHNAGKHEVSGDNLLWAPGDEITVEFCNYSLTLYVNEELIHKWKLKEYKKLKEQAFIPTISVRSGSSCEFLGITYN